MFWSTMLALTALLVLLVMHSRCSHYKGRTCVMHVMMVGVEQIVQLELILRSTHPQLVQLSLLLLPP